MDKRSDKMTYDEDDDLFQPTTFKGKLKEKIPDLLYGGMAFLVFVFVASSKPEQAATSENGQTIETVEKVKKIEQTRNIVLKDSVKVR